jgi:CubicO group peptidase (beta-lactamase class C family)
MRRRLRKVGLGLLAIGWLGAAALGVLAPQVFRLAREGFPAPVWPAPGSFVTVAGVAVPADPPRGAAPPDAALARFRDSGGRALLVDRGGTLQIEAYGPGIGRDTRLNSYSMVKSLVGALALRAVAEGRIASLDARLTGLVGPEAPDLTLREVLTMTSGLMLAGEPPMETMEKSLEDAGFSPFGPVARLHAYGIEPLLPGLRIDPAAKGRFQYQSANTALVGLAVERAWGRPLPDLLSEQIWAPAGAAAADWRKVPAGDGASAWCCLYARAIDWLRVSRYLMENGTPDAPFLPDALWRAFVLPDLSGAVRRQGAYGLHLRHDVLDWAGQPVAGPFAYMMGHGGQIAYLLPGQDAIVVRFGAQAQLLHSTLYEVLAP